jgi:3-hydroxyisobutyrate dehydrogenase-like beta-hydroxyacid dehydrogenase
MGCAMATNVQKLLLREGRPALKFWNRTASRGAPLVSLGASGCDSIERLVTECDIIFISVSIKQWIKASKRIWTALSIFRLTFYR